MSTQDDLLFANSDSFWEVDGYKRTVKRTEDGFLLCGELMKMIQDRSDLEKDYAKKLKAWSKKWNEFLDKSSEYGTTKAALKGSLDESDRLADVHLKIKEELLSGVQSGVKDWRSENYKKQIVGICKEAKNFEEDFKRAQKPWNKRLAKVLKSKKDYHTACKLERTAANQESNAKNNTDMSLEQLRKFQERLDKSKKEVVLSKERYQQALIELNAYNGRYVEDMTEVYQKAQEFEDKRLNFIKGTLFKLHQVLDLTKYNEIPSIYRNFCDNVNTIDSKKDLTWWSENHGTSMQMSWPSFEEYITEFHNIASKEKKASEGAVLLTHIHKSEPTVLGSPPPREDTSPTTHYAPDSNSSSPRKARLDSIPENDLDSAKVENNVNSLKGIRVRALYDYEGQEKDELSFSAGEIFVKLRDKDSQGWCTGCRNGQVGLYPDSYVEVLSETAL